MKVVMPIPLNDFDPTEVSMTWSILTSQGIDVVFAVPTKEKKPQTDMIILTGKKLGLLKKSLKASKETVQAYDALIRSDAFSKAILYSDILKNIDQFKAIVLPGGHAKGMIPYLENVTLQEVISIFFEKNLLVAAICHGVVLTSRSKNKTTGKSVLYNYQTTALLKKQEMPAWFLTMLWLGSYFRTYKTPVEKEVKSVLKSKKQFKRGKFTTKKDTLKNLKPGFIVKDRNYISSRWPGDVCNFSLAIIEYLKNEK